MSDLRALLYEAAGPLSLADSIDPQIAEADLARGHRARRRRRTGRMAASSGLVAALALSAFAVGGSGLLSSSTSTPPVAGHSSSQAGFSLVSYTGKQPTGFILDKVPAHWQVESIDASHLLLAPEGKTPSPDPAGMTSFVGKVAVTLDVNVPQKLTGDKVEINGRPGVIFKNEGGDGTRTLYVKQAARTLVQPPCTKAQIAAGKGPDAKYQACGTITQTPYLSIQVWGSLGWSNDQIVELGNAIHVTKDSTLSAG